MQYPDSSVRVSLALAKTRPCPIRKLSLPKLELKAAVLGVCLAKEVNEALKLPPAETHYWSDAMNVLFWVRSQSRKFQTDIGNRIAEIQEYSVGRQWQHISGKLNPADEGTRGLSAEALCQDEVWWHGPSFLMKSQESHAQCGHSVGPNHLLTNLRQRYWIVQGKAATRAHRASCVTCKKRWAKVAGQKMAPLPDFRTSPPFQAFAKVGIDYAGPFSTKQGRGRAQQKRYMCVITCLQTRACHLEIAFSLTTDGFLQAFTRFCKRRGVSTEVVSDNGGNFVCAERELRDAVKQLNNQHVAAAMARRDIEWHFNPPQAPHFGGVLETMARSAKRVMIATLSRAELTDEELLTAMVQAEALLNSRPLTTVHTEAGDLEPLTPQHFLASHCQIILPAEELAGLDANVHPTRRWRYVQRLMKLMWQRWLSEFVPQLNVMKKWVCQRRNLKIGDVVLAMEPGTARGNWPLAIVTATYPGTDGLVRVVDVKVRSKTCRRPVNRLVPLEVEPSDGK